MAVIGELDLEIHGRTPDDVNGALCPGRLHDLVEQVRGQNLGILYRNTRVQLRELGDQVGGFGQIRRGLDHKADLRPARFCFLACARVLGKGLAAKEEVYRKPEDTGERSVDGQSLARRSHGRAQSFDAVIHLNLHCSVWQRHEPGSRTIVLRILIIEDDTSLVRGLKKALTTAGFAVDHETNGAEAIEIAPSEAYSLIVLDLGLPGLPGQEVLRRLRNNGCEVPILILTALGEVKDKVKCLNLGADDYLNQTVRPRRI